MKNLSEFQIAELESGQETANRLANRFPATVWGTKGIVTIEVLSAIKSRMVNAANPFEVAEMQIRLFGEIRKTGKNLSRPKGEAKEGETPKYYYDLASGLWFDYTQSGFDAVLTGDNLSMFNGALLNRIRAFKPAIKTSATDADEAEMYDISDYELVCKARFDSSTGQIGGIDISFKLINA
jgi:hypothetical protein